MFIIGLPVAPSYGMGKIEEGSPRSRCMSHFPSMGPIFGGRGRVISGRLANTYASRFGKNTKLLRGVIGLTSIPNDYLYTVFDDVVSLCGSRSNNALPWSPREKLQLFLRVKSPAQEYAICRSPCQIETYSLVMDSG